MKPQPITDPRKAVLRQLAEAHDRFAQREQIAVYEGNLVEAEGAHQIALWLIRAYRAEMDEPEVAR